MRQLSSMMGAHPSVFQDRKMLVAPKEGEALEKFIQALLEECRAPCTIAFGNRMAQKNGPFAIST